jgi:hypothetical protein
MILIIYVVYVVKGGCIYKKNGDSQSHQLVKYEILVGKKLGKIWETSGSGLQAHLFRESIVQGYPLRRNKFFPMSAGVQRGDTIFIHFSHVPMPRLSHRFGNIGAGARCVIFLRHGVGVEAVGKCGAGEIVGR